MTSAAQSAAAVSLSGILGSLPGADLTWKPSERLRLARNAGKRMETSRFYSIFKSFEPQRASGPTRTDSKSSSDNGSTVSAVPLDERSVSHDLFVMSSVRIDATSTACITQCQ